MHLIFSLPSAHSPRRPSFIHALDVCIRCRTVLTVCLQLDALHGVPGIMSQPDDSQGKLHTLTAGSERRLMATKEGCLMA